MIKNVIYACLLFFVFFACKKYDTHNSAYSIDVKLKSNILIWMDNQKSNNPGSSSFIDALKEGAQWEKAELSFINTSEQMAYIPVQYNGKTTGLVFIVNTNNQIELGYLSEISYKNQIFLDLKPADIIEGFYKFKMNSFSGSISAYAISNKFLWEMGYNQGLNTYKKLINKSSRLIPTVKIKTNSTSSNTVKTNSYSCTYFYLVTYWDDGSTDRVFIGSICSGSDCEQTMTISKDTTAKVKTMCSGGGGGGSTISAPDGDIHNNCKNPCLKAVTDKFINGNLSNAVTDILQKVFNVSNRVNITFSESTTIHDPQGNIIEAQTNGNLGPTSTGEIDEDVFLNPDLLGGTTQEYIGYAVIHEIIHASLLAKGFNLDQHLEMLEKYMDTMSTSLQSFFPNLTPQQSRSLCLQGLGNTVTNSQAFTDLITKYGFNRDPASYDNWALFSLEFKVQTIGTACPTPTPPGGGPGHEIP